MANKRRGHNEGSIYQRKDGRWCAAVSLGIVDGKRRRKVVYGETQDEVKRKRTEILRDLHRGLPVRSSGKRLDLFLDEWLETAKPNLRPSTYYNYQKVVEKHLKPELGRITVDKLTQKHVQQLLTSRLQMGLAPGMVLYIRNVLRIALNLAMRWDLVARNVATLVEPPRVPRYEPVTLDAMAARALLDAVEGDRLSALYVVSVTIGLRQSEALGLRWQDVDLETGVLMIRKQLQRIGGQTTFTEPKTSRSTRTIPLSPFIVDALKQHRMRQLEERLAAGGRWQGQWNLVFCQLDGSPLVGSSVRDHFLKVLERAGLPRMRWHDLRHSAASMMAARGVHPTTTQAILGHETINTTLGVYSHADRTALQQAVDGMDDALRVAK